MWPVFQRGPLTEGKKNSNLQAWKTLVESLVAIVVLAIGIAGLAALDIASVFAQTQDTR